jgi:hypothetical protein
MLKVERCMQSRLMLSPIISERPTSTVKDRTLGGVLPLIPVGVKADSFGVFKRAHI